MSVLSEKKLITNEKYHKIYLTEEGLKLAKIISEKHQVIQKFFTEVLNIDNTIANTDACAIEHVISNYSITAMNNFLNNVWIKNSLNK
jgi:Mn-dependent DtxR family transcriptional regulator